MTPDLSSPDVARQYYQFVADEMSRGTGHDDIKAVLMEGGLTAEAADSVIEDVARERMNAIALRQKAAKEAKRAEAKSDMLYGALWCIGGLVVTIGSFVLADANGGGRYVVTWGAVIFGAYQFFRGVMNYV